MGSRPSLLLRDEELAEIQKETGCKFPNFDIDYLDLKSWIFLQYANI